MSGPSGTVDVDDVELEENAEVAASRQEINGAGASVMTELRDQTVKDGVGSVGTYRHIDNRVINRCTKKMMAGYGCAVMVPVLVGALVFLVVYLNQNSVIKLLIDVIELLLDKIYSDALLDNTTEEYANASALCNDVLIEASKPYIPDIESIVWSFSPGLINGSTLAVAYLVTIKGTNNLKTYEETVETNVQNIPDLISIEAAIVTCPLLVLPPNGESISCTDENNFGSVCTVECQPGYQVIGPAILTCIAPDSLDEEGVYDHAVPSCIAADCNALDAMTDNITTFHYYTDGFRYDTYYDSNSEGISWNQAQQWCLEREGVLAYSEQNSLDTRKEVASGLGIDENAVSSIWYGVHKVNGEWTYLNGSIAEDADIHWLPGDPETDDDCSGWISYPSNPDADLQSFSYACNSPISEAPVKSYPLCQYKCL